MIGVVVLPLAQLLVEQVDVLGDAVLVQELVELLVIDSVGSFDHAVEMRVQGRMYTWRMSRASRCQCNRDWNSAP